jgi:hypothetical protein
LKANIIDLIEPDKQADLNLKTIIPLYLDHREKSARHVDLRKNWLNQDWRCVSSLNNILISPTADVRDQAIEKIKLPNAIFTNGHTLNKEVDTDSNTLKISVEVNANVTVDGFSTDGGHF